VRLDWTLLYFQEVYSGGLSPTCISETDLYTTASAYRPFLFGREDLRERTEIYDTAEAANPFYHLVNGADQGLKETIVNWIRNVSDRVKAGDRIIIILIGHGQADSASVVLNSRVGKEYLTKTEISTSLSALPPLVRVILVNEACYSGTWATVAIDTSAGRDVLVEAASMISQPVWSSTPIDKVDKVRN
jgi:hypothetical protein